MGSASVRYGCHLFKRAILFPDEYLPAWEDAHELPAILQVRFQLARAEVSKIFSTVKREDKRESLRSATEILKLDPEKAKTFETTVKELMKSHEMLKGDPFLVDYLTEYTWLIQIYVAYYKDVYKRDVNELEINRISFSAREVADSHMVEDARLQPETTKARAD